MKTHWTAKSISDYLFRIAADFIAQLENKMEKLLISQDDLAKKLGVTKGRVSQWINHPGNFRLGKMIEYAKALGMKVSVVAYEDDDPENKKGPIDSEIFKICWEKMGKPRDFWDLQDKKQFVWADLMKSYNTVSTTVKISGIGVGAWGMSAQAAGHLSPSGLQEVVLDTTPTQRLINSLPERQGGGEVINLIIANC